MQTLTLGFLPSFQMSLSLQTCYQIVLELHTEDLVIFPSYMIKQLSSNHLY